MKTESKKKKKVIFKPPLRRVPILEFLLKKKLPAIIPVSKNTSSTSLPHLINDVLDNDTPIF